LSSHRAAGATAALPAWDDERRLQHRVLSCRYRQRRDEPSLLESWQEARRNIERRLRESPPAEACREIKEQFDAEAHRSIKGLEDGEAAYLLEGGDGSPRSLHLASLIAGERLRWLRRLLAAALGIPKGAVSDQAHIESDWRWLATQAHDLGRVDPGFAASMESLAARLRGARKRCREALVAEWSAAAVSQRQREGAAGADALRAAWNRVLEARELGSDLVLDGPPPAETLQAMEAGRAADHERCRGLIARLDEGDREAGTRGLVMQAENHVSSMLSEGDLLEGRGRIVKYRAAAAAVQDLEELLGRTARRDLSPHVREELRHLRWMERYALRSAQSFEVEDRLEGTLGRRLLHRIESAAFVLILVLVALVVLEWRLDAAGMLTPPLAMLFQWLDLGICSMLLVEIFVRWAHAGWAGWFLRRHLVFDFLPALPYGFLFGPLWHAHEFLARSGLLDLAASPYLVYVHHDHAPAALAAPAFAPYAHLLLLLRLFRAARFLRAARGALTFLRMARLLVFMVRGMDRAVKRWRGFLDRNILVFEPEPPRDGGGDPLLEEMLGAESRCQRLARELYLEAPGGDRPTLLEGHASLLELQIGGLTLEGARKIARRPEDRDFYLESLILKLLTCDAMVVEGALSHKEIDRLAQVLRWADLPIVRWLPLLRSWAEASRVPEPSEAVAEAARALGAFLQRLLSWLQVWGDLSGITTGPQVLDRIATAMIRSTQGPAVRLIVIGSITLLISIFAERVGLEAVYNVLEKLGLPFVILGSVCLAINLVGRWFKRISGEALDVFLRTSEAHFFHLIKEVKLRRIQDDVEDILRRVLLPECAIRGLHGGDLDTVRSFFESRLRYLQRDAAWAVAGSAAERSPLADFLHRETEQTALLYRDYLDGTMLEKSDDKTSIQLLGNLAMRDIRLSMLGMGKRELRRLEKLALEKDRLLGFGPYLWFRFISESLSIETAKLVMEYNSCCIPKDRLRGAPEDLLRRRELFLKCRQERSRAFDRRRRRPIIEYSEATLVTTEFNALHFLLRDAERDRRVAAVFGDDVLAALIEDRRNMVRDIFGTWPYHLLPRSARRINPYRLYFRYLGGARVVLLPLVLAGKAAAMALRTLLQLVRIVREVLNKEEIRQSRRPHLAGYDVAVRKINRMRKPYFMEAMRLRAAVDAEYLGLRIPGLPRPEGMPTCIDDLDFIGAVDRERLPFEELRRIAIRDLRRLRAFLYEKGWSGGDFRECLKVLDPENVYSLHAEEALRALVSAFITDQHGLRTAIVGPQEIQAYFQELLPRPPPGLLIRALRSARHAISALLLPRARARRRLFEAYVAVDGALSRSAPRQRRLALHAFLDAHRSVVRYCETAVERGRSREAYDARVIKALDRVAAEHNLWSRKLITLRMVQALTVLDIRVYRELVWSLGGFEEDGAALKKGRCDPALSPPRS
jgi:hypothetical protein